MKILIFTTLLLTITIFLGTKTKAQKDISPYQVNPLIGDTLSLEERDYYQLFPLIEGFQFAVFYLNSDSSLNAYVNFQENGTSGDTLIDNYRSLKSLNYHIYARNALENKLYETENGYKNTNFNSGADVSVYLHNSSIVAGELLSVRRNNLLILKQKFHSNIIKTVCIDNINRTEIDEVIIKGNSNLGWGISLGILASVIAGVVIYQSYNDGSLLWGYDAITPIILSTVGCITLGVAIGINTSTPDVIINPLDKYEYQRLIKYSRYRYNEPDELKSIK